MAILTDARRSIWAAIDNHAPLANAFRYKVRFDEVGADADDGNLSGMMNDAIEPSLSDLPAILIVPTTNDPAWWTHEMAKISCLYAVTIWTQDWYLPAAEDLIEKAWQAAWRAAAEGSAATYIKAATGYYPTRISPIQWQMVKVGRDKSVKATRVTMTLGLRVQQDLLG